MEKKWTLEKNKNKISKEKKGDKKEKEMLKRKKERNAKRAKLSYYIQSNHISLHILRGAFVGTQFQPILYLVNQLHNWA